MFYMEKLTKKKLLNSVIYKYQYYQKFTSMDSGNDLNI